MTAWNSDPILWVGLFLALWLYHRGLRQMRARTGQTPGIARWQLSAFTVGLLALFVALISPLDALGGVLFSAHMVQHLILMFIAAPLLSVSGAPLVVLWALPLRWRHWIGRVAVRLRPAWHGLSQPLIVWLLQAATLWLWHLPGLFQAALVNEWVHGLEHISFLLTSGLFWWVLFRPTKERGLHYGFGMFYLFTAAIEGGALGALLLFSNQLWYPTYAPYAEAWGTSALGDQQLAGAMMWMPIGIAYLILSWVFIVLWFHALEQKMTMPPTEAKR